MQGLMPILKWAGGKRWLAPTLKMLYENSGCDRLAEPFCGGLAVSLEILPTRALLNDVNPDLIDFYETIKAGQLLPAFLEGSTPSDRYQYARNLFNSRQRSDREQAWLFLYLNKNGFNGLCRYNKKGQFNVPFGKRNCPVPDDFPYHRIAFSRWTFTCGDFSALTPAIAPNDFIYADPPYDTPFASYHTNGFSWQEQVNLVEWLCQFDNPIALSNQATDRIVDLYASHGFSLYFFDAPRRISCNGNRADAKEVLAIKNAIGLKDK